ncbi:MAG TPA: sigma-54 dependent transcriptional regulator [Candidatus Edwardsbacteria bacterium]|nr:sigma-54 dependent transcriptional regulator [Candidatus Edwardsbacteria bacterium]
MTTVLIVDDEAPQRSIVSDILKSAGYEVLAAASAAEALQLLRQRPVQVALTDLKMPGKSGLTLIEEIRKLDDPPEAVLVTAYGSIETAVKAMKLGAYDYLTKPLERDELLLVVERAAEKQALRAERRALRSEAGQRLLLGLVAESEPMKKIMALLPQVARSDSTVLIRGESGTGKERIARLIHHYSSRGARPLQAINCAAFPETLLESELFGHEKGAFTGAAARKPGIIETAAGSTLFLDEVADMPLGTQVKLLRVLQEKEIRPVGSVRTVPVDFRLIAATNRQLEDLIGRSLFREDLYYRLNVIPIEIPPLRQRPQDIPALVGNLLSSRVRPRRIEPAALELLVKYAWPGNVRELEAVIERVTVLTENDPIRAADLPVELTLPRGGAASQFVIPDQGIDFEQWEKELLVAALKKSGGVMADAAKLLGMTYRTFQYRANKFGIKG